MYGASQGAAHRPAAGHVFGVTMAVAVQKQVLSGFSMPFVYAAFLFFPEGGGGWPTGLYPSSGIAIVIHPVSTQTTPTARHREDRVSIPICIAPSITAGVHAAV